jgi:hypothetical protein
VITHRIIKFKPKIIVPLRYNKFGPKDSPIRTTEALLEHVKTLHPIGAYVTLCHNVTITHVGAINYVIDIAREYSDDLFTFQGKIEAHKILNLNTNMTPWIRWVAAEEYRLITDEERQVWIDAHVSDYIKSTLECV